MTYEDSQYENENRVKQKILVSGELIFEWNVESQKLYSLIEIKYLTFWRISSYVEIVCIDLALVSY